MTQPLSSKRDPDAYAAIWKFTLEPWQTSMELPAGARLLHAHEQSNDLCLWAEVDPHAPTVTRKVMAIPTGGLVNGLTYIGTAHLVELGSDLVFHVYDGGEVPA